MGFLGKQFGKAKKAFKEDLKRSAEVRKVEREALHEARLKEAKKYGAKKAAMESKSRLSIKKQSGGGFGALAEGILGPPPKKGKGKNISDFI